jgi:hypothetical protein
MKLNLKEKVRWKILRHTFFSEKLFFTNLFCTVLARGREATLVALIPGRLS